MTWSRFFSERWIEFSLSTLSSYLQIINGNYYTIPYVSHFIEIDNFSCDFYRLEIQQEGKILLCSLYVSDNNKQDQQGSIEDINYYKMQIPFVFRQSLSLLHSTQNLIKFIIQRPGWGKSRSQILQCLISRVIFQTITDPFNKKTHQKYLRM